MMKSAMQMMGGMDHKEATRKVNQARSAHRPAMSGGYRKGDRVELHSLKGAAEHNGKQGTVVGPQGERIKVLLDDSDSKTLALKVTNLTKLESAEEPVALPDATTMRKGMEAMSQADPEQLKAQAAAMRNMDPDTIRRMNPAMANLSDEAICASADQMEAMASNPEMIKMAQQQLAGMSPEALEEQMRMVSQMSPDQQSKLQAAAKKMAQNGDMEQLARDMAAGKPPDAEAASKVMEALDEDAVQEMVGAMKQNPTMIKQMMKSSPMAANLTEEQLDQQVQALQNIDDETLKKFVGVAKKIHGVFKPFILGYSRLNRMLGGRLLQVLGVAAVALFVRSIARRFTGGSDEPDGLDALKEAAETVVAAVTEEDEFAVEGEL
jgi:ribosomal protein L21E